MKSKGHQMVSDVTFCELGTYMKNKSSILEMEKRIKKMSLEEALEFYYQASDEKMYSLYDGAIEYTQYKGGANNIFYYSVRLLQFKQWSECCLVMCSPDGQAFYRDNYLARQNVSSINIYPNVPSEDMDSELLVSCKSQRYYVATPYIFLQKKNNPSREIMRDMFDAWYQKYGFERFLMSGGIRTLHHTTDLECLTLSYELETFTPHHIVVSTKVEDIFYRLDKYKSEHIGFPCFRIAD